MRATGGLISTHIALETTTLARIMKITRQGDGLVTRITDHDEDIQLGADVLAHSTFSLTPPDTGSAQAAVGVLSMSGNALDSETVTIDGVVYTFVTGALDATGKVKVGADIATSLFNLKQAIIAGTGAGMLYASGTTAHATVTAEVTNAALPNTAESTLLATGSISAYFSSFTSNSGAVHDGEQVASTTGQPKTTDQTTSMWFGVTLTAPKYITHVKIYPAQMVDVVDGFAIPVSWWFGPDGYLSTAIAESMMTTDGFSV